MFQLLFCFYNGYAMEPQHNEVDFVKDDSGCAESHTATAAVEVFFSSIILYSKFLFLFLISPVCA